MNWQPGVVCFKPSGIPMHELQEEVLGWDEVELNDSNITKEK